MRNNPRSGRVANVLNSWALAPALFSPHITGSLTCSLVQSPCLLDSTSPKGKHHVLPIGLWSHQSTWHTSGSQLFSFKNRWTILPFLWIPLSSGIHCGPKGCVEKVKLGNPSVLVKAALALCLSAWAQLALGLDHSLLLLCKLCHFIEFLVFPPHPLASCGHKIKL